MHPNVLEKDTSINWDEKHKERKKTRYKIWDFEDKKKVKIDNVFERLKVNKKFSEISRAEQDNILKYFE